MGAAETWEIGRYPDVYVRSLPAPSKMPPLGLSPISWRTKQFHLIEFAETLEFYRQCVKSSKYTKQLER